MLSEPIIFEVIKGKKKGDKVSLGTLLDLITVDGVVDIDKILKDKGVYNARITDESAKIIHEAAELTNKVDKATYKSLFAAAALAYKPLSDYVLSRSKLQDPSDPENRILPQDVINQKVRLFKEQMGYKSSKPGDK